MRISDSCSGSSKYLNATKADIWWQGSTLLVRCSVCKDTLKVSRFGPGGMRWAVPKHTPAVSKLA